MSCDQVDALRPDGIMDMKTVPSRKHSKAICLTAAYAAACGYAPEKVKRPPIGDRRPWSRVQLTKSERRGKSFEEIEAMRKARWEEENGL